MEEGHEKGGAGEGRLGGFVPWRREWETFSGLMVRKTDVLIRMSTQRCILLNCDFWNHCWEQMWILILFFPLIHHPYLTTKMRTVGAGWLAFFMGTHGRWDIKVLSHTRVQRNTHESVIFLKNFRKQFKLYGATESLLWISMINYNL